MGIVEKKFIKDGKDRKLRIVEKFFYERLFVKLLMGFDLFVFFLLKSFVIFFEMKEFLIYLLYEE